jgi:hypothetical protein
MLHILSSANSLTRQQKLQLNLNELLLNLRFNSDDFHCHIKKNVHLRVYNILVLIFAYVYWIMFKQNTPTTYQEIRDFVLIICHVRPHML